MTRKDKSLAIELRKQRKSYNEISKLLNIPKSTLAEWFKESYFSKTIKIELTKIAQEKSTERMRLISKAKTIYWKNWREAARQEAKREFKNFINDQLFIAGTMLYWAEGDSKLKNPLRLTNTDHRMISLYLKFLIRTLNFPKEKIRATLILYPDLSEENCLNFWSKITELPQSQFYKTQFIKGKHPTRRLTNGICMIIINSRQLKEKFIVWIDLLSKNL